MPALIAIAGFRIIDSTSRSAGYGHFTWKRLLRVGRGFVVSMLLVFTVGGGSAASLDSRLTMGIRPIGTNQPIWSLGLEAVLYGLLAIWLALGAYRTPTRAMFVLLAATSASAQGQDFLIIRAALAFVCGSALYIPRDSIRWSPIAGTLCLLLA